MLWTPEVPSSSKRYRPEPETDGHEREKGRDDDGQVNPGLILDVQPSAAPLERSRGGVARGGECKDQEDHDHAEGHQRPHDWKEDDVERHVLPQNRIEETPNRSIEQEEDLEPHGSWDRGPEPRPHQHRHQARTPDHVGFRKLLRDHQIPDPPLDPQAAQCPGHDAEVAEEREANHNGSRQANSPLPQNPSPKHGGVTHGVEPEDLDVETRCRSSDQQQHEHDADSGQQEASAPKLSAFHVRRRPPDFAARIRSRP